jgi:hypothetical protein
MISSTRTGIQLARVIVSKYCVAGWVIGNLTAAGDAPAHIHVD